MSELAGKPIEFVSQEVDVVFQVASGVSTGTMFHDLLNNRDAADQHPIGSITGLNEALNSKQDAGSLDNVDNTSDLNKPISSATQDALDGKADSADFDRVDNTTDLEKPISTATQSALDGKISTAQFDQVDNTADLDKPVSTAQQAALDLKLDTASYMSFFANESSTGFNITSDEPAYEEVDRLTMVELDVGTYEVKIAGRVQSDTVGRSVFIRWSLDGGATWEDPAAYNVLDATDKKPFTHVEIIGFTAGARTVIVQAAKVAGTTAIVNKLDIVCERKI